MAFALLVLPAVIALIAENTGHVKAVAEMTERDLDPVMGKAIAADGFGTVIASAVGGSPTTTYAENIGVMAATRVYSTAAYYVAAVVAILFGLCPKFGAVVSATPGGVLGGITVVLYGMIGLLGAKIWKENGVDFANPVNLVPVAAGIIIAIGDTSLKFTDNFSLSGISLGTIVVLVGYHLARAIAPPELRDEGTMMAVGRPGVHARGASERPARTPAGRPAGRTRGSRERRSRHSVGRREAAPVRLPPAARPGRRRSTCSRSLRDDAKVLAGGQSLVPLMSMRLSAPAHLVDVNHVPGLDTVEVDDDVVRVGALARHSRVEHHAAAYDAVPLLRQALRLVAHPTIRNRGTTVGSLVHADPAAEMPAVLCLLDGTVTLRDVDGSRDVAAADFFVGPMESALRPGELAVHAIVPAAAGRAAARRSSRCRDGRATTPCAASAPSCGATARPGSRWSASGPARCSSTCDAAEPTPTAVRGSVDAAIDPEDDIHASADYRRHLAHVLVRRALDRGRGARRMSEATVAGLVHGQRRAARARARAAPAAVRRAAPRPAAHRHPRRLRARRVRRLHRARRRRPGAVVPAVRGVPGRRRDHHHRGAAGRADGGMGPVQQAFHECHALQCGFCTPGFVTTVTAFLRRAPGPDPGGGARGDLRQPVPLHRLRQHRRRGAPRRRAASAGPRAARDDAP